VTASPQEPGSAFSTLGLALGAPWRAIRWLWRKTWRYLLALLVLLIIGHTIFNFIAGRKLEAELARIRKSGAPLSLLEAAPPQVPDSENAAVLYQEAFKGLTHEDSETIGSFLTRRLPEGEKRPTLEQMEEVLGRHTRDFQLLEEASRRPACRFPVNWEAGFAATFPHLAKVREATRFLAAKAIVEAKRGRSGEALEDLALVIRMTNQVSGEPTLIAHLVRVACIAIVFRSFPEVLASAPPAEEECRAFYDLLAQVDMRGPFSHGMQGERACGIWAFEQVRKAKAKDLVGLFFLSENPEQKKPFLAEVWWPVVRLLWGPFLRLDEVQYLRYMEGGIAFSEKPYREIREPSEYPADEMPKNLPWYAVITRRLSPIYTRANSKRDEAIASISLMRVSLALRVYQIEHGEYPASLDELQAAGWEIPKDPFTDKPFIYRREGTGYLIYSVGPNLADDRGTDYSTARLALLGKPFLRGEEPAYDIPLRMTR